MKNNNTVILITGGLGFIGTHLVLALIERNYKVVIFDNFSNSNNFLLNKVNKKLIILRGEVRDYCQIEKKLKGLNIDIIIHLAAIHYIPDCEKNRNQTMDVNLSGTINMLRFAESKKISRFIFASTADVYKNLNRPYSECDTVGNKSIYAISKILSEKVIQLYAQEKKISFCIFRLFNVYGSKDKTPHFIPRIIKQSNRSRIMNHGNINTIRDYIYIDDVVNAFTSVVNKKTLPNTIFNIGSGCGYSGKEIIKIIERITNKSLILRSRGYLFRPIDRHSLIANNKLFSNAYSWNPKVAITTGLQIMLKKDK